MAASVPAPARAGVTSNGAAPPPAVAAPRQVLVLEAFTSGKRINYDAVAAQVAAMTAGDVAALRDALQRGLPMTLPLPPGAHTAVNLQALTALQVKARVVTPATMPVLLDGELRRRLATTHQLVVRDVTVGQARQCHCRRCGYVWKTMKAPGEPVPLRCPSPSCRSPEWGRWRIFKCAWCGHEFDTADVHTRRPERLVPSCPCCGLANWESGRPPGRTSWLDWLDRMLALLAGTALLH